MRVLCTGGVGFIGRHVCRALKQQGHYVVGLDCRQLEVPPQFCYADEWFQADITKPLPDIPNLDAVIHLAAIASPRECEADPAKAYLVNVHGTWNVLEMARKSGAKKVVFSSSAHVYGIPPLQLPTGEDAPVYPQSTYTTTKILGESLCRLYWETHRQYYTVLRLFNTYGPGQSLGYFVPDMIAQAQKGLVGLAGHKTTKDFVYVTDVARAFCRAVGTPYIGALNIGSGEQTQLGAIAGVIAKKMGAKFTCSAVSPFTRMQADWQQAKQVLGWEPAVSIWEGLDAVIAAEKQSVH